MGVYPMFQDEQGPGLITLIATMVLPVFSPILQAVGWYIYMHILVVIGILIWFFTCIVPPPSRATERHRRRFQ
jgi:hypothetical protein